MLSKLKQWIKRSLSFDITAPGIEELFNTGGAASGVPVTRHTAFQNPAWYHGIDLIASTCAKCCVAGGVMKRAKDGGREYDEYHAAYPLLTRRFNNWITAFDGVRQALSNSLWSGNGYIYAYRDDFARPLELHVLDSQLTYPIVLRDAKDLRIVDINYITSWGGVQHTLDAADVIHIKSALGNWDGFVGMSLIEVMKDVLGLAIAEVKYASHFFEHDGANGLVIEIPTFVDKEKAEALKSAIIEHRTGVKNMWRPLFLQGGAKASRVSPNPEEAALLGAREFSNLDIALILGIAPHKLGVKISTSYSSLESQNANDLNECYDKHFVICEQEFSNKLLTEFQKDRDTHMVVFNRERLIQCDTPQYSTMITSQYLNGLRTKNEARKLLNLDGIGPDGDEFLQPSNLMIAGEDPTPEIEPSEVDLPDLPEDTNPANMEAIPPTLDRAKQLTSTTISRLVNRLKKSVKRSQDLESHMEVFLESLAAFPKAKEVTERLFNSLADEIDHVLPEQVSGVLERVNVNQLVEELWR